METLLNKTKTALTLIIVVTFSFSTLAQKPNFREKRMAKKIKGHIEYLASDALDGRGTGSAGEQMSARYIANQFGSIGLEPGAKDSFFQYMDIPTLRMAQPNTSLLINRDVLTLFQDFYPLSSSSNNGSYSGLAVNLNHGINDPGLKHNDYKNAEVKGKTVLIKIEIPDGNHPHSKFAGWIGVEFRAKYAKSQGARAVIYYTDNKDNYPSGELKKSLNHIGIPVLFVNRNLAEITNPVVDLNIDILLLSNTASNVIGRIYNGAPNTVIVGAHHDHLGHGESGGSLAEKEGDIHNGADDNASGVASLIELARFVKKKKRRFRNNNYIFVAFTGEELGLLGSKYFVKNTDIMTEPNYMINMDMVGHLDSTHKTLIINGIGTSPQWKTNLESMKYSKKKIAKIKTTESGIGSSDHTSFYLEGIPAIHFFTGQHQYYHKPTDDVEIVNMDGTAYVTNYIAQWLCRMDKNEKIKYAKTKDSNQGRMSFKVTLGVMPDYVYDGEGMRIDGVKEGKPADKAGIIKGDIVMSMNGKPVSNMKDYMSVLKDLNPGDKIPVLIRRNGEPLEITIQF